MCIWPLTLAVTLQTTNAKVFNHLPSRFLDKENDKRIMSETFSEIKRHQESETFNLLHHVCSTCWRLAAKRLSSTQEGVFFFSVMYNLLFHPRLFKFYVEKRRNSYNSYVFFSTLQLHPPTHTYIQRRKNYPEGTTFIRTWTQKVRDKIMTFIIFWDIEKCIWAQLSLRRHKNCQYVAVVYSGMNFSS